MKRVKNIKQEFLATGDDGTKYKVCITGDINVTFGFIDEVFVYGRAIQDDLIHLNYAFGSTDRIEKYYTNGGSLRIDRKKSNRKSKKSTN